jgi:hypothetical protein
MSNESKSKQYVRKMIAERGRVNIVGSRMHNAAEQLQHELGITIDPACGPGDMPRYQGNRPLPRRREPGRVFRRERRSRHPAVPRHQSQSARRQRRRILDRQRIQLAAPVKLT